MKQTALKVSHKAWHYIKDNRFMLLVLRDRIRHDDKLSANDKTQILILFSDCFHPTKLNNLRTDKKTNINI